MQPKTPEQYRAAYEYHKKQGNKDNAARVAQLYRQHLAQQQSQVAPEDRDNAFQFSIDQAQKMYGGAVQDVGRLVGSQGIEQYGKQVSDKQDQDIAKGGYQSNYSSARDSYEKEGLSGVAKWATEGVAENAVSGGAALVGTVATAAAAVYGAPAWLVGTLGAGTLINSVALGTGDNVLEQQEKTGDFDARVATGVGIISGILDRVGAKRAIPDDLLSKMTTKEVIGELMSQGKVSAAKEFAKRIGAEAVTETAQEALNIGGTALVGGEYTTQEVKDRTLDSFLLGGAQAGAMNTGISTLSSAANLVKGSGKKSSKQTERQDQAQASFAQRLAAKVDDSKNADGPVYDLRDVDPDSRSGAKAVIDSVHTDMAAQLKTLVNLLKSRLKPEKTDPLDVVLDKSEAAVAAVKAKNKVKNVVDASDFKSFENLVGDTAEGQLAINLMHELNELTRVYSDGLTGGVSRYTDAMSPVGALDNYSNTGGVMQQFARPLATVALATANPGLAAAQVGTFTAGRAIDKVTGKRSRVGTYVAKNQNNPAQPVPTQPSLRNAEIAEQQAAQEAEMAAQAAAEQRAAEEREANLDLVQRGAPPLLGSPEDIFRDGTGLDRSGLAQVIRILKANPNTKVATRRAIEAYETSIATGGRVDFTLIRNINSLVDQFPQLKQLQQRPRNQARTDEAIKQQYSQQQQNYERGIENNRQFATQLTDALNADKSVQPIHKALLLDSLGQMQLDLGANPVSRLQAMEDRLAEKGVPVEAVQQYFAPYIERVVAQQEAKQSLNNTEQAVDDADPVNDARIVPVPRGNQAMQNIFGVTEPGEGGNYIDLDSKQDLTGNTYQGGVVKIINGKPLLETSDTPAVPATKDSGNKVKVNLFKQKAGWKWIDYDGPETIVSTHQGNKHHYSLSSDFETPVTLQTYPKQPSEPRLRPTSQGKVVLGKKIGSISVRGKVHPVYDEVKVVDKRDQEDPVVNSTGPALTVSSSPNVISLMDGSETAPKLTGKTEVAKYLEGRAKDKLGRVLDIAEPSDRSSIADSMVLEAIHEMESQDEGSAMDWYDATIEKMLEMMALKYPEIATDDNAKTPMLIALSIMSQNMDVPTNLAIAEKAYEHFRENGRFSINGQGKSQKVMELNFKKANTLLEKLGSMARLEKFLATKFTVKTLNPILNEYLGDEGYVGGENVDTEVYGSSVFGPKVGNGFYTNLTGDFSPVTMDMWFMRTVGRLKGNLMEFEEAKFQKQLTRLKKALNRKRISREQLIEKAFDLVKKHEADYKKNRKLYDLPKGHAKRKVKSSATLAAYTIKNSLKNTIDSPASGTERNNLRLLVTEAVAKFNEKTGLDIEPAAFQALIWYPEQDLYKKLGVRLKNVRKDFATSLKELLIKEGYNEKDLNSAVARVQQRREQRTGQVRQGTAQADRSPTGQTSRPSGSSVRGSRETGPVLATEDPVNNSVEAAFARVQEEYLQPTPAEIKEKLPEAEDIVNFTIGKKGTAFENGVRSEDDIRRIAALLDISISVLNTKEEASKSLSENTRGNYGNKMYGTAGHINIKGENLIGRPQYIATLTHEVGHGVEGQTLDRAISDGALEKSPHPRGSKAHNAVSYRHGSYREHMHFALKIAKGEEVYRTDLILPDYDEALEIRREIDHIQEALVALRFPGFAEGSLDTKGLVVRESVEKLIEDEAAETARRVINNGSSKSYEVIYENSKENMMREYGRPHIRYLKDTAEFAVDSVVLYLTDPQLMKLIAPVTAAYMKKIFKKSGMPVKFYASPLASVMAILLAGIAKGIGGEEEEQVPGALSMQPGLLST